MPNELPVVKGIPVADVELIEAYTAHKCPHCTAYISPWRAARPTVLKPSTYDASKVKWYECPECLHELYLIRVPAGAYWRLVREPLAGWVSRTVTELFPPDKVDEFDEPVVTLRSPFTGG